MVRQEDNISDLHFGRPSTQHKSCLSALITIVLIFPWLVTLPLWATAVLMFFVWNGFICIISTLHLPLLSRAVSNLQAAFLWMAISFAHMRLHLDSWLFCYFSGFGESSKPPKVYISATSSTLSLIPNAIIRIILWLNFENGICSCLEHHKQRATLYSREGWKSKTHQFA